MIIYEVYNQQNTLISAHAEASQALKQALIYQHYSGQPAYVEQINTQESEDEPC
jgi:hypothetical protein